MDLSALKGKTLDDSTHAELVKFVADLEGKVQQARDESISHRKGLKEKVERADAALRLALDKLGVDGIEELEQLPDAKGQAEALRQFEAKVKRLERERDEASGQLKKITAERDSERMESAISRAVVSHGFIDTELTASFLRSRTEMQDDGKFVFKAEGGKLVPLDEGAAWIAKTKPHLVKAQGGTGSGYRPNGNGSQGATKSMTRAEFEGLDHTAKAAAMREKVQLTD